MNCPSCKHNLRAVEYEGIHVETCTQCHGEWLDADELKHIVKAREVLFDVRERKAVAAAASIKGVRLKDVDRDLRCPTCGGQTDAINKGLDNDWWKNVKAAYQQPEMSNDDALRFLFTLGATKWQYTNGVKNPEAVSPDTWGHVQPLLDRDGNADIQLQMFYSYGSNPPLYPAWQQYLRDHQPPTLIVWGEHDEISPAAGAEPYKRDLDKLEYHLIDTGHFALETHGQEIADLMRDFLSRQLPSPMAAN